MNEQAKQDAKAKRLAEQLRANLRRRKAQARVMKGGGEGGAGMGDEGKSGE